MLDEVRVAEIENRANYCLRAYRGATILNCANDCLCVLAEWRELRTQVERIQQELNAGISSNEP